jgi:predicted phosphodiesterase
MNKWSEVEDKKLLELVAKDLTTEEIARELNRSYKSIAHRRANLTRGKPKMQTKEEKTSFTQLNKDLIYELKERLGNVIPLEKIEHKYLTKVGDTLIVHFTDWHIGRIVKDEEGNELYNTEIFKRRIDILLQEILTLLDNYITKGTPIKDVVIISTGDILDGMGIYATQETQSELSPPFQVMMGVEIIQKFVLALLKRKLTVTFYGVKGNHGEIREGGKSKDPNANWDLQLYLILDFWCKNVLKNTKVKVYYSELDYLNFEVQGWRYHIRHIAPQQSETAAGKAKFLGWARKHNCDVLIYGHYHHYGITDRSGVTVIKGGSITGADEYSERLAEEAEPIQLLWGCSKHRPITFMYAIDLGERKKK